MGQLAETFRGQPELERQSRLQGVATLSPEWTIYLKHEQQMILDGNSVDETQVGRSFHFFVGRYGS
jgi:hypothetical protein